MTLADVNGVAASELRPRAQLVGGLCPYVRAWGRRRNHPATTPGHDAILMLPINPQKNSKSNRPPPPPAALSPLCSCSRTARGSALPPRRRTTTCATLGMRSACMRTCLHGTPTDWRWVWVQWGLSGARASRVPLVRLLEAMGDSNVSVLALAKESGVSRAWDTLLCAVRNRLTAADVL